MESTFGEKFLASNWHAERRKKILAAHPELKQYMKPNPMTAVWYICMLIVYVTLPAYVAHNMTFWPAFLLIFAINTPIVHNSLVLTHEATHNLVFKTPLYNRLLLFVASLPFIHSPLYFRFEHLLHHAYLEDLPNNPEYHGDDFGTKWFKVTKAAWHKIATQFPFFIPLDMLLYHLFYNEHVPMKEQAKSVIRSSAYESEKSWLTSASRARFAFWISYIALFGWASFGYLLFGEMLTEFKFHPIVGTRLGEHCTVVDGQPSNSMYGWQNWLTFNVGYHVEHHDLPNIPWNHLHTIRTIAREFYDDLYYENTWYAINWRWITGDPVYQEDNYLKYLQNKQFNNDTDKKSL